MEARRSRVARAPSRSDAEGALDLGGTAPQAARHRRRHPQKRQDPYCTSGSLTVRRGRTWTSPGTGSGNCLVSSGSSPCGTRRARSAAMSGRRSATPGSVTRCVTRATARSARARNRPGMRPNRPEASIPPLSRANTRTLPRRFASARRSVRGSVRPFSQVRPPPDASGRFGRIPRREHVPGVQEDHPTRPDRRHVPLLPLRREGRVLTHQHRKGEHTPWLEIAERDRHRTRADAGLAVLGAELTVIVDAGRAVLGPEVHDADAAVDLDRVGPCGAASPLLRAPTASRAVAPRATPDDLRASAAPPAKHTPRPGSQPDRVHGAPDVG